MTKRPLKPIKRVKMQRRYSLGIDKRLLQTKRDLYGRFIDDETDPYEHMMECIMEAPKLQHLKTYSEKFMAIVDHHERSMMIDWGIKLREENPSCNPSKLIQ